MNVQHDQKNDKHDDGTNKFFTLTFNWFNKEEKEQIELETKQQQLNTFINNENINTNENTLQMNNQSNNQHNQMDMNVIQDDTIHDDNEEDDDNADDDIDIEDYSLENGDILDDTHHQNQSKSTSSDSHQQNITVIVDNDTEDETFTCLCFEHPNENQQHYLIKPIKLTRKILFRLITLSLAFIAVCIFVGLTYEEIEKMKYVLMIILFPIIILIIFMCFEWFSHFHIFQKITRQTFQPYILALKSTIQNLHKNHLETLSIFNHILCTMSFISSYIFFTIHINSIFSEKPIMFIIFYSLFILLGIYLSTLIIYVILCEILSLISPNDHKAKMYKLLYFTFPPTILGILVSQTSESIAEIFALMFFGVLSFSLFIAISTILPILYFKRKQTEKPNITKILLMLPFMVCILIVVLLTWIMIFLPGNKEYLPSINYVERYEFDRKDGIQLGGYNKEIHYYSANETINPLSRRSDIPYSS